MAYYTWSQGFRPGGFNRTSTSVDGSMINLKGVAKFTAGGKDLQFNKPSGFVSDNLVNNEVGFKSEFFSHRLQFNASLYQMDWKGVQLPLFDPVHLGNTTFDVNGPTYRVRGVEIQAVALLFPGFTVQGSSSWNASAQTDAPCLRSNRVAPAGKTPNPTPLGECITQVNGLPYTNPFGVLGTRAPFSPPLEFNVRARYDWTIQGGYNAFASIGASPHRRAEQRTGKFPGRQRPGAKSSDHDAAAVSDPRLHDLRCGDRHDEGQLDARNSPPATWSTPNAVSNISSGQFIKSEIPIRPRVIMFGVGYKF